MQTIGDHVTSLSLGHLAIVTLMVLVAALLLHRLKQPPIVGFLLAGFLVGPHGFGIIEDSQGVGLLAEIGVLLLLFSLGMEMSLRTFRHIYRAALPATGLLIGLSLLLVGMIGGMFGWELDKCLAYGFIISLSSTAVSIKLLEELDMLKSQTGQVVVGMLIAQDLAFVPMSMVLGSLGPESSFDMILLVKMFLAIGGLASIVWFFGRHKMVDLPFREELRRNRDILPVASLAACLMGAAAAEAMGMSASYGAFVAGLIIGNTSSRNELLEVTTPLQNAMLVVFFLSIGLMLDPRVIIRQWQVILALLLILNVFKSVVSVWLLRIFLPRSHWRSSFFTGLTMGQIGEFSFILAAVSLSSGIFSIEEYRVVVSLIALSLTISPLWNVLARRFHEITFTPDGSVLGFRAAFRRLWAATPPRS